MHWLIGVIVTLTILVGGAAPAWSEETAVKISPDLAEVTVETAEGPVVIRRNQDTDHEVSGYYARTSRECSPFCIQPARAADGVETIGELELLAMLIDETVRVIDARTLEWHLEETIPGSTHIPYTEVASRLDELGCVGESGAWDCTDAVTVALYCNGIWCGQSPAAIRAMLREGYPAERIFYYRGGMQAWKILGLTTVGGTM